MEELTRLFRVWQHWTRLSYVDYPDARERADLAWELYVGELLSHEAL